MGKKIDHKLFEKLGTMIDPAPPPPPKTKDTYWEPSLTPSQRKLFDSVTKYILTWSQKGSGKTIGCLHKLVKHCYENADALSVILVRVRSMANMGGAWEKLQNNILPEWKEGLGLNYSEVRFDSQHNEFLWIQNCHGGWSKAVLISAPHAHQLRERIRGYEPSFVFVDELTSCDSPEYFQAVTAQLGRRPFIDSDQQQYIAACNPEGQSHWVYQKWFVQCFNEETGEWDPDFENIFFPADENEKNLPGYLEGLKKIYRDDPIEAARMVGGEWIDRPSGEAIFREIWNPTVHVRPLTAEGNPHPYEWLMPHKEYPVLIGLDPGAVYNAFIFMQWLLIEGKMKWMIFDEIVTIKKRISYEDFIPMVMRRVKFWRDLAESKMRQIWISDNSAFNQYRAAQGSYDVLDIERIYEANRAKYGLEPLGKIKQAPKFTGSKVARTRIGQRILGQDEIIVSTRCKHVQQMFMRLESEKQRAGEPFDPEAALTPKRSDYIHTWDAMSYVWLLASLSPTALTPSPSSTQRLVSVAA